jgi:hypothetical protein
MMTNLNIHRNPIVSVLTAVILAAGTFGFASQNTVQEGDDLKIVFSKPETLSAKADSAPLTQAPDTDTVLSQPSIPKPRVPATALVGVNPTPSKDGAVIHVEADGALENYKSFTLTEAPPRIVFDFPGLHSPHKSEQRITVKTGPVSRVRHFAHPEKVRLVVETQKTYLASYTTEVVNNGFLIHVGDAALGSKINSASALEAATGVSDSSTVASAPLTQAPDTDTVLSQPSIPKPRVPAKDLKLAAGSASSPPLNPSKPLRQPPGPLL